jgi:SAM-dependent methyltransferase
MLLNLAGQARAFSSSRYWNLRYQTGGDSGGGSFGDFAVHKADFINSFVTTHAIKSVLELGCGDGNQLAHYSFPQYIGLDVSPYAIERCVARFGADKTKTFMALSPSDIHDPLGVLRAELALSIDVIYHLIEDEIFADHLRLLFSAASKWVIIYSSNFEPESWTFRHVRHREFLSVVDRTYPDWDYHPELTQGKYSQALPGSHARFFVFQRREK